MKILLAASEVTPIIKIGGLGDVIGSLPKALATLDVDVDIIVPYFSYASTQNLKLVRYLDLTVPFGGQTFKVTLYKTKLPSSLVDLILVSSYEFFSGVKSNYFANNSSETRMFAFFSKCVVEYIKSSFNTYDLVHCNDWHTGAIPGLLKIELGNERPATLFTIHNIAYQGVSDMALVKEVDIGPTYSRIVDVDIEDNSLNLMQQGVSSADFINTVSVSYAEEILDEEFGAGINGILKNREGRLTGILNGIDYANFPRTFSGTNFRSVKSRKKDDISAMFNFISDKDRPLFVFIGRLDPGQKGIDLIYDNISFFKETNSNLVILGKGSPEWEKRLLEICSLSEYKRNVVAHIDFDTKLANDLYEASDFILIPSKYEPCGLVQMIGMWYGSVPIARSTGGLKDSITDGITGILFSDYSGNSLNNALRKAVKMYDEDTQTYETIAANCLKQDFGWQKSALKYKDLYIRIIKLKKEVYI
jgi:starch synthase